MSLDSNSESELPPQRHFLFCPTQKPDKPSVPPKPTNKTSTKSTPKTSVKSSIIKNLSRNSSVTANNTNDNNNTMRRGNAHELLKRTVTAPSSRNQSQVEITDNDDDEKTPVNSPVPLRKVSSMMINLARSPPPVRNMNPPVFKEANDLNFRRNSDPKPPSAIPKNITENESTTPKSPKTPKDKKSKCA